MPQQSFAMKIYGIERRKRRFAAVFREKNLRKMLKTTPIEALHTPERDAPATIPVNPAL
jgi:hypothetical protein